MSNEQDRPIKKALPPDLFVDFGGNAEMRWEAMSGQGYLTERDRFYVRNHGPTPTLNTSSWSLRVEGPGVEDGLTLDYEALMDLPSVSVTCNLECAGNGRVFFDEVQGDGAAGEQWRLGAVGVAEWTGVRLGELLSRAGLKESAVEVVPEGLDEGRGRRPMPVRKALEMDTLVAYAMNGEPLSPDHGFPARVIVPGWYAVASIKWIGRIYVSEEPVFVPWNTEDYVLAGPGYEASEPALGPVVTAQGVKSALELPWPARLPAGRREIRGRAWSGAGEISRVDYSLDGGASWSPATLAGPNLPRAWAEFRFEWEAAPGEYEVRVRATDIAGNTQPDVVPNNDQGYLYNAVVSHPVTVYRAGD